MKIGYSETFPVIGSDRWQKIPLEIEVTPDIDFLNATDEEIEKFMLKVRRVQYALRKQVQSFFFESNKAAEKQSEPIENIDGIIDLINKCTTVPKPHGIMAYEIIAKTNKSIQEAWDKKFIELSQQTK